METVSLSCQGYTMVLPDNFTLTKNVSNVIIKQTSHLYTSDLPYYLIYKNGQEPLMEIT